MSSLVRFWPYASGQSGTRPGLCSPGASTLPSAAPGRKEMTVSPGEQEDIRRMDRTVPRNAIARELGSAGTLSPSTRTCGHVARAPAGPEGLARHGRPSRDRLIILEADLSVPRKQRHTAKRSTTGPRTRWATGLVLSIRRYVAAWRGEHAQGPRDGYPS